MKLDDGADIPDIQIQRMSPEQAFQFAMENLKFDLSHWLADLSLEEPTLLQYPDEVVMQARDDLVEFASRETELDEQEAAMWSDMTALLNERLQETYH